VRVKNPRSSPSLRSDPHPVRTWTARRMSSIWTARPCCFLSGGWGMSVSNLVRVRNTIFSDSGNSRRWRMHVGESEKQTEAESAVFLLRCCFPASVSPFLCFSGVSGTEAPETPQEPDPLLRLSPDGLAEQNSCHRQTGRGTESSYLEQFDI